MFTRIPVDLALQIGHLRSENDVSLNDRTMLSVDDIYLYVSVTYFSFRGVIYQQVYGTAMGSPVANLVMENIEEKAKALSTFSSPPVLWKRYVDDVCTAIDRTKILAFLEHLNNIHHSIQFTHEMENSNKCLPFLDVLLERNDDGSLSTSVYPKPSHTDRYVDFSSHHPLMHKASVVRSHFNRAKSLSACAVRLNKENCHILNVLKANHYPKRFIDNAYLTDSHEHSSEETPSKTVVIPYIKGLSEGIKRIFSNVKVKVVFRPLTSLRQHFVRPKDPVPSMCKANIVYSIPYTGCSAVYIGQTSRSLETRIKEAVKHARIQLWPSMSGKRTIK